MCLKSEYVYFPQLSGCVYHPVLTSFTLSLKLVITLMVMTVPSVKVLHGSPWSCSEISIPPESCLCGCWSQRLQNSALLVIHAFRTPEFHDAGCAEARGEPSAQNILPPPFLKCAGWGEIAAMQNIRTKREPCATGWNLHGVGLETAFSFFLVYAGHCSRCSGFTFLLWVASALRELQCLLGYL